MTDRLDEEKLETLRRWGEGLSEDARDEVRAAGRAILLLIEEIERLHIDLWHERERVGDEEPVGAEPAAEGEADVDEAGAGGFLPALRARLRSARHSSQR